jgi:hypothetical protein
MHSRHPLQEQVVAAFVPNDTYIAGGNGTGSNTDEDSAEEVSSIAVLTGANACGKVLSLYFISKCLCSSREERISQASGPDTVYGADRMVSLSSSINCLSSNLDSFVPVQSARLGVVDKSKNHLSSYLLSNPNSFHSNSNPRIGL